MTTPDTAVSPAAFLGFVTVFSGVLVVDVAVRFFAWRSQSPKLKHLEMIVDELRLELHRVRNELGSFRNDNHTSNNPELMNHVIDEGPPTERHVSFVPTSASSLSTVSDYFVRDVWSPVSIEAGTEGDLTPLLANHSDVLSLQRESSSSVIPSSVRALNVVAL